MMCGERRIERPSHRPRVSRLLAVVCGTNTIRLVRTSRPYGLARPAAAVRSLRRVDVPIALLIEPS
jgi:hypothetical protein